METFPTYAKLLFDGYGHQRESAVSRTNMESGPPKQLKTKSRVMVTRPVSCQFATLSDYDNFIAWFTTNINRGADWFTFIDPISGTSKSARIVEKIGNERLAIYKHCWMLQFSLETWE